MKHLGKIVAAIMFINILLAVGPAVAHHKEDHDRGGGRSRACSTSGFPDDGDDNRHPSGKDRETCDGPEDDAQGGSPSDPDDNSKGPDRSNGGADKPGGSGGQDKGDQDGNNGCGNDDDFEDDNEGLCGGPTKRDRGVSTTTPRPKPTVEGTPSASPTPVPTATSGGPTVGGDVHKNTPSPTTSRAPSEERESVGGVQLPTTGNAALDMFLLAAAVCILGGTAIGLWSWYRKDRSL